MEKNVNVEVNGRNFSLSLNEFEKAMSRWIASGQTFNVLSI